MSLRESLEKNKLITCGVLLVVLAGAIYMIVNNSSGGGKEWPPRWVFDLNSQTIRIANSSEVAPFDTGSGTFNYPNMLPSGAGVDAFIYTCGSPEDIKEDMTLEELRGVGADVIYVTRFADSAKAGLEAVWSGETAGADAPPQGNAASLDAKLMSDVTGEVWVPEMSGPAFQLRAKAFEMSCGNDAVYVSAP